MIIVLDQLSKFLAERFLVNGQHIVLMPNFVELVLKQNTGIAFSMFNQYPQVLTVLISTVLIYLIFINFANGKLNLGLAFIIGGGLGNLIDRFMRGYVVDFINPLFVDFAVFNVADIALNVGVALIIIEQLMSLKKK